MCPSQTSHCSFCMGKQITMLGTGPSPATSVWGQSKKVVLCQTKQTKIKRIKQLDKVGKHKKENFLHVASTFAYCFQCVLFAEIESFTSPNWQQISKAPSMKQESYYWERLLMMWCLQWIHSQSQACGNTGIQISQRRDLPSGKVISFFVHLAENGSRDLGTCGEYKCGNGSKKRSSCPEKLETLPHSEGVHERVKLHGVLHWFLQFQKL